MNANKLFPSKWLRACDAEGQDLVLTIQDIREERIGDDTKPVLYFQDHHMGFVLNKTNMNTIISLHGSETDDWTGRRIALYSTTVEFRGEQVDALRVRSKPPKPVAKPPTQSQPKPTPTDPNDPPF